MAHGIARKFIPMHDLNHIEPHDENERSKMLVTVAASHEKVVMIEAGGDQIPDDVMYNGIVAAHEEIQVILNLIDKMVAEIGKEKFSYDHAAFDDELFTTLSHELTHHMEGRGGLHALDDRDAEELEEYRREYGGEM